jgi:hypothetical protein
MRPVVVTVRRGGRRLGCRVPYAGEPPGAGARPRGLARAGGRKIDAFLICFLGNSCTIRFIMLPEHIPGIPRVLMKILLAFGFGLAIAALL